MKKTFWISLVLAGLALSTSAWADTSSTFRITVTVVQGGVSIERAGEGDVSFGTVTAGAYAFMDRLIFKNNGYTTSDWSLAATEFTDLSGVSVNWAFVAGTPGTNPGTNNVRLSAIWDVWNYGSTTRTITDFGTDDTLSATPVESSESTYAITGTSADLKGYNVPAVGERSLWFAIDAPDGSSNSLATMVVTTITVSASAH